MQSAEIFLNVDWLKNKQMIILTLQRSIIL
jgi:hypothetical protein